MSLRWMRWGTALGVLAVAGTAPACSGVGPPGQSVVFGDQTNIIIWDAVNHTEHFIRNASFKSGATDFGFIAPTPNEPHLSEASQQAFFTLAALGPQVRMSGGFGGGGGGFGGARSDEVRVIQEADVAGYHATTLLSESAKAINDWMNQHGYVSTPEVERWADRYCRRGWYLTAYKVIDKSKLIASTGTVRMSFKTDAPYNPFYVPASNIPGAGAGTLKVYFVSVGDYDANIGYTGRTWQTPQWTAELPDTTSDQLAREVKIPADSIPQGSEVEAFVDTNFPRPAADDIYFTRHRPTEAPKLSMASPSPTRPFSPAGPTVALAGLSLLALVRVRRAAA